MELPTTVSSAAPDNDFISAIPVELKLRILSLLSTADIINIRRLSRGWGNIGAQELFKDGFKVRPDRDDIQKLADVVASSNPDFIKGIRSIILFAGDTSLQALEDEIRGIIGRHDTTSFSLAWKPISRAYTEKSIETYCHQSLLGPLVRRLPNLEAITLDSSRLPFSDASPELREAWNRLDFDGTEFQDRDIAGLRYNNVLLLSASTFGLKKLVLDNLPILCLKGLSRAHRTFIRGGLAQVEDLRVKFIVHQGDFWKTTRRFPSNLGYAICSLNNLRNLDVEWKFESPSDHIHEWLTVWRESFLSGTWPQLKSLSIEGTFFDDTRFLELLGRHATTLKNFRHGVFALTLKLSAFYQWNSLSSKQKYYMRALRDTLQLEKADIMLDFATEHIYDPDWNALPLAPQDGEAPRHKWYLRPLSGTIKKAKIIEWFLHRRTRMSLDWDFPSEQTPHHPGWHGIWSTESWSHLSEQELVTKVAETKAEWAKYFDYWEKDDVIGG